MGFDDAILLEGALVPCALGVTEGERKLRRAVRVDLEVTRGLAIAGASDRLDDTIDYGALFGVVEAVAAAREYALVEALAEAIAAALLERFPIEAVRLEIRKSRPLAAPADAAGGRITRRRGSAP